MTKQNNNIHIFLLIALVGVFFILMFMSTSNKNITQNYNFYENVELNENDYNIKIGELEVSNSGFLASKIALDTYKGCIFDTKGTSIGYDLSYAGSTQVYDSFSGYSPKQYVEIESNDKGTFAITLNGFYGYLSKTTDASVTSPQSTTLNNTIETKTYDLYLFKLDSKETDYYNYCLNAKPENSVNKIKLIVNYENK